MNQTTRSSHRASSVSRRQFLKGSAAVGAGIATLGETGGVKASKRAPAFLKQEKIEVSFWHQEVVPKRVEVFQKFIDSFNAENADVEVTQET